jgi:hypothetical protein
LGYLQLHGCIPPIMYLYELVEVVVSGVDSVDKYDLTDEKT